MHNETLRKIKQIINLAADIKNMLSSIRVQTNELMGESMF